jgi:hypothetical protein
MLNKKKLGGLLTAVVIATGLVGPASAATISWSAFTGASNLAPTAITGNVLVNRLLSEDNLTVSPFQGSVLGETVEFNSVGANSSATYTFATAKNALRFVWGSVDTFNYIDFYRDGGFVETFLGKNAGATLGANRNLNEIVATIKVASGFDEVRLRSTSANAFEHQGIAAVPVPAAGFLLVGALGGLAALRRRKKAA